MQTNNKPSTFIIDKWSAWAPGIENACQWGEFLTDPDQYIIDPSDLNNKANVSFIPAMQRRRLSPLARAVFHVAEHCIDKDQDSPSIFSSMHGESQRTYALAKSIAENDDVSPMAFSLSVHNAISGQFGILFDNTQASTALAPYDDGYLCAIADGIGQLKEGASSIIIACYEENLPEFYQPYTKTVQQPTAVAFRLSLAKDTSINKNAFQLHYSSVINAPSLPSGPANTAKLKTNEQEQPIIGLIRFLNESTTTFNQGHWQIIRQ